MTLYWRAHSFLSFLPAQCLSFLGVGPKKAFWAASPRTFDLATVVAIWNTEKQERSQLCRVKHVCPNTPSPTTLTVNKSVFMGPKIGKIWVWCQTYFYPTLRSISVLMTLQVTVRKGVAAAGRWSTTSSIPLKSPAAVAFITTAFQSATAGWLISTHELVTNLNALPFANLFHFVFGR